MQICIATVSTAANHRGETPPDRHKIYTRCGNFDYELLYPVYFTSRGTEPRIPSNITTATMFLLTLCTRGVATGWTCPPHFCQRPFLRLMQIWRVFFFGGGVGVANVHLQQQPGCKCFFCSAPPFTCLLEWNLRGRRRDVDGYSK